jgi:uncharacterized repeat protein (TIGR03803 family)
MRLGKVVVVGVLAMLAALAGRADAATTFGSLHSFSGTPHNPNSRLVRASDGNLYGTASGNLDGKDRGVVYRMTPAGAVTVVHVFTGPEGEQPVGLMAGADGLLYGVTQYGGTGTICPSGCGVLYSMDLAGSVTVLHDFKSGTLDGQRPTAGIVQAPDGSIYGTTEAGVSRGTAWRYVPGGAFTILHAFSTADPAGADPRGGLVRADDGNYYGVTNQYGPGGQGTVFRLTPAGTVTLVHGFGWTDGGEPRGQLLQHADGLLYGVTEKGGAFGFGTIFRVGLGGTSFGVVHDFFNDARDGGSPVSGLVEGADGLLYGVTPIGGQPTSDPDRSGVVYRTDPAGHLSVVHTFTGPDGDYPQAALSLAADGSLYGTTWVGGSANLGTAFRLSPAAAALSAVAVRPSSVPAGTTADGQVTLTAPAPPGGAVIALSSGDPSVVQVKATVTVPAGASKATFQARTLAVATTRTVTISTSWGGVTRTAGLTVTP